MYISLTMAELINQILALPRSEKWHILTILTEVLRNEEKENSDKIPDWQIGLAAQSLEQIEQSKVKPLTQEQFWAAIDAKVEQLERRTGP